MKRAVALLIASAGAAHAQVNSGFEFGDLTGYASSPGASITTNIVQQTVNAKPPFAGSAMVELRAGEIGQAVAAAMLDVAPGRLGELYIDLGGTGDETSGDYNILRLDLPPGNVCFGWLYEGGDVNHSNFVDHAFVVNGAGLFKVLHAGTSGTAPDFWQTDCFYHPGGPIHFVCANGGDTSADPLLYIDVLEHFPIGNYSFEEQLIGWHVEDNGLFQGTAINLSGLGQEPTDGELMAQLQAGELPYAPAEESMNLWAGGMSHIYFSLGGTGDPNLADCILMSAVLPAGEVTFDWLLEGGDVGNSNFVDHAYLMNGAGEIQILYSGLDPLPSQWRTETVNHPGGKFYFVCANGGDSSFDPFLYIDNVRVGKPSIDSTPAWVSKSGTAANWGGGQVETYGQTFVSEADAMLRAMTFYVNDLAGKPIAYEAYVYEWNGSHAVGQPVFASGELVTDGLGAGFEQIVVTTPGARVASGKTYVAFVTVSKTLPTNNGASLGRVQGNAIAGNVVNANNDANFNALFTNAWNAFPAQDLAIRLDFDEPDASVAPYVYRTDESLASDFYPWNAGTPLRYQQLYRADQLGVKDAIVDAVLYRADRELGVPFADTTINCFIWLGHSTKEPGQISNTFDQNFTAGDKTLVHSGPITVHSIANQGFDIEFDIDDVFEYNGEDNLLMEIMIFDGSANLPGRLDASVGQGFNPGNGPSTWTDRLWATVDSQVGDSSGEGLITRFRFAEPEAGCIADCDANGTLNILDFVCYQFRFTQGDPEADCDANGALNILDFVCFQQAFQGGCE